MTDSLTVEIPPIATASQEPSTPTPPLVTDETKEEQTISDPEPKPEKEKDKKKKKKEKKRKRDDDDDAGHFVDEENKKKEQDDKKKKAKKQEKERNKKLNEAMEELERKDNPIYLPPRRTRIHHPAVWCVEINNVKWMTSHEEGARASGDGTIQLKVNYEARSIDLRSYGGKTDH